MAGTDEPLEMTYQESIDAVKMGSLVSADSEGGEVTLKGRSDVLKGPTDTRPCGSLGSVSQLRNSYIGLNYSIFKKYQSRREPYETALPGWPSWPGPRS